MQELKSQQILKLRKSLKSLLNKERLLVDIFIFGSVLKGKNEPEDIDLVSLFRDKDYKLIEEVDYAIKKEGDKLNLNIHIEPLIVDNINTSEVYKNIIHEGFSIKNMNFVSKMIGFNPFLLITYNLRNKKPSEKVMFSYALFGRKKGEGLVKSLEGKELGKGSILIPIKNEAEIVSFFKQWNVEFNKQRIFS